MLASPKDIEDFSKRFGESAGIPSLSVGQQTVSGLENGAWNNLLDLAAEELRQAQHAIGEITGVGRETVKSRLRYAMDRLRTRLNE